MADGRYLDLDRLRTILTRQRTQPLDLLVLSACETATGDRRAALGLSGTALRSGAASTLASLWSVDDRATAMLMQEFYRSLARPGTTKAQALRTAQITVRQQYAHPYYWSAFVLVGNWL
jgi:CHAT domain-containing protein